MCNEKTRGLLQLVARDLRHQTRAQDLGQVVEWLDRTVDQLEVAVSQLQWGDVRAQGGAIDAWHHAQQALALLRGGGETGPMEPRLIIQAYLRIAAFRAWEARVALDASDWGDGPASQRAACAEVATAGGRRA